MLWEPIAYIGVLTGCVGFATSVYLAVRLDRLSAATNPRYRRTTTLP